ncbi:MAG TPA: R3H domain-containing nucleic acid-binding protein, partial [Chloroflexota bacterium]|nr:R3H domain-containing nucleic acid-binding protein [Chloroflexota bacterium]
EEARRRGTQKSVLERKAPPTFDVFVEIQNWSHVAVHENVADVVDAVLRGQPVVPTVRRRGQDGEVLIEEPLMPRPRPTALADADHPAFSTVTSGGARLRTSRPSAIADEFGFEERRAAPVIDRRTPVPAAAGAEPTLRNGRQAVRIYPFGVNRSRLESQIRQLGLPAVVVANQHEADVVLTVRNYYRRKPQALRDAEASGVPVHVLRSNSAGNIEQELLHISHLDAAPVPGAAQSALRETEEAIARVLETSAPIELSPQSAYIRRLQHQLAEQHSLSSRSTGKEPYRRVRISKAD